MQDLIHRVFPKKAHLSPVAPLNRPRFRCDWSPQPQPCGHPAAIRRRQTARKPGSVPPPSRPMGLSKAATAIPLGRPSPGASCDRPERRRGDPPDTAGLLPGICRSYLVLLPVGFSLPPPLLTARCALTAPFHPCRPPGMPEAGSAVSFLWHCPWGRPRRALPGTVSPWSPDFPLPARGRGAAIRPSGAFRSGRRHGLCQRPRSSTLAVRGSS